MKKNNVKNGKKKITPRPANSVKPVVAKKNGFLSVLKVILVILTIIYPLFMNIMSGLGMFMKWNDSGLVYNSEKYSSELTLCGWLMIAGGLLMTASVVMCIKKFNIAAIITSSVGFALCMLTLYKIAGHADSAGWSDKYTMSPVSDMYIERILPTIAPFIVCVFVSIIQFFSWECADKRRQKRSIKAERENAEAPKII